MSNIAAIVLAAGESSRLGRPKQLLQFRKSTLIRRIAETAVQSNVSTIVVVLGAHAEVIEAELDGLPVQTIINQGWKEGMSTSIQAGINKILEIEPPIGGVILLVSDQPFISSDLLNKLIEERKRSGKSIVACSYDHTIGTPVFFSKEYFSELLRLKGQEGAKKLLQSRSDEVQLVSFPRGNIDIDTLQDYQDLTGD
jgi:molybdenum cofactor cytidylyltransferase